ncbi:MAG: secretin N-terminal domain-containing protein [Candidatus Omnitrophota bacterium]|nr:hypothetical protein [Candidatus Omnitrophota bacterium]
MLYLRLTLILFFLSSFVIHPVYAQDQQNQILLSQSLDLAAEFIGKTISLDLRDMEIKEALKFFAGKIGFNIIPTKDVSGRITLMVENVAAKDVFDIMLRSNSLAYYIQGNIYNVMTEKEYQARYGKNFTDYRQVKIFELKYAIPEEAYNMLNSFKSSIGKMLVDRESGTILVIDTPDKIAELENALNALEKKSLIKVFNLKYARAKDMEEQLQNQLDLKKVGYVKADIRTNQIIVQTLPERMVDIARLIESLDTRTLEVLLDVRIVQVRLNNKLSSGIEWEGLFDLGNQGHQDTLAYAGSYPFSAMLDSTSGWQSRRDAYKSLGYVGSFPFTGTNVKNYTAGTQSLITEQMHLGLVGSQDFDFIINYLKTLGDTRILSNPKLAVINNQEAKIHVGEKQAYITTTTTQSTSITTTSEAVTYVDVGIQLAVTPTINDDGFVTIKIKPEISSVLSYLETSNKNKIPILDTSMAETIVMVKDGTSILIGGLSKEEKISSMTGTPILSKIPFIGEAFRQKTDQTVRSELLILITPHIIKGDELVTGYDRALQVSLDKRSQEYTPLGKNLPQNSGPKQYQNYEALVSEQKTSIQIKPLRNFEGVQ